MKPHPQAEWIKAKADGYTVQKRALGHNWQEIPENDFTFSNNYQYRIKPSEPEKVYPLSSMLPHDFDEMIRLDGSLAMIDIANAAIRRAIDDGQVFLHEKNRGWGRDMKIAKTVLDAANAVIGGRRINLDLAEIIAGVK